MLTADPCLPVGEYLKGICLDRIILTIASHWRTPKGRVMVGLLRMIYQRVPRMICNRSILQASGTLLLSELPLAHLYDVDIESLREIEEEEGVGLGGGSRDGEVI